VFLANEDVSNSVNTKLILICALYLGYQKVYPRRNMYRM